MEKQQDRGFLARKPLEAVRRDAAKTGMHRTLGPVQLIFVGIGCIIGAGVYVMTGTAAAQYAGPAVILSFGLAAVACAFVCLCYAELASVLPASGASYTYAYSVLGEAFAWGLGWMLMLEFGLAGSALAVGFTGYLVSLLGDFGIHVPTHLSTPWLRTEAEGDGTAFVSTGGVNLVAVLAIVVVVIILSRGIKQSAAVNALLVAIKVSVLIGFVVVGVGHVDSSNWTPFIPPSEGDFRYGVPGIFRAASILFFAYLGFEAVATAAAEARKPHRDVPIGILGALAVSTLLYGAVALVLTGLVSYRSLNVPDPIAVAIDAVGMPTMAIFIKAGALAGLGSVLLINTYAHSRVLHAMATDGFVPAALSRIGDRSRTPVMATALVGGLAAIAAALLPISLLGDLVSLGTICVFIVVSLAVMRLRASHPELPRPFKVPLGGIMIGKWWLGTVPILALLSCILMAIPVLADITAKAAAGEWLPATILIAYLLCGLLIYFGYGRRNAWRVRSKP